mmetsp:Transcript_16015/g.48275  ORF Transcript_16015/g.48275 Transcript_16015/m.48275 type:complete len:181 (+) Transcript_16015:61-603(+)
MDLVAAVDSRQDEVLEEMRNMGSHMTCGVPALVKYEDMNSKLLQEMIWSPYWQVVRADDDWEVINAEGVEEPVTDALAVGSEVQGVILLVTGKSGVGSAQRYVREFRKRFRQRPCICVLERSKVYRDPVVVSMHSQALLVQGADQVVLEGMLSSSAADAMALGGENRALVGGQYGEITIR